MANQGNNLGIHYGWLDGEDGWGEKMNDNLLKLDSVIHLSVKSKSLSVPPSTPTEGDRYIVVESSTGDWLNQDKKIAIYQDSKWTFYQPKNGWVVNIEDENHVFYRFIDHEWIKMTFYDESVEQEISLSVPAGDRGNVPFINKDGTRETDLDFIMKFGAYVDSGDELDEAKLTIVTNAEIFNTWLRYSHDSTENQPANYSETQAWSYNPSTDLITSTVNSTTHIGFASLYKLSKYEQITHLKSTNADDDMIGFVIAFHIDPDTNRQYTLTALRSPGGFGDSVSTWSVWYNWARSDGWRVDQKTQYIRWGNGNFGATQAQAGYTANNANHGWSGSINANGTRIKVVRDGDLITCDTTQFNQTTFVSNAQIQFTLTSDPRLEKFRGPQSYGYCAHSQDAASFQVISTTDIKNIIYDVRDGSIWVHDGTSWVLSADTLFGYVGLGRMLFNDETNKLYFIKNDSEIKKVAELTGETEEDITSNVTAGGIVPGDVIPTGSDLEAFIRQLLITTYYPTFITPSATLSSNISSNIEAGTIADVILTMNFNRGSINGVMTGSVWNPSGFQDHRSGQATKYTINGIDRSTNNNLTISTYQIIDSANTWSATVDYALGPQPVDSTGANYDTRYPAGDLTRSTTVNGRRNLFYGVDSVNDIPYSISDEIRALSNSVLNPGNNTNFNIAIPSGAKMVVFAYPSTIRDVSSVKYVEGMNAEVKSAFTQISISVEGANGYNAIDYRVYYYIPASPFSSPVNYNVTI